MPTPFHREFVESRGLRIHYRSAGQGPPVVMLHPSPLSSQAVLPVATAIAAHRRVFAIDTPGYGLSDPLSQRPEALDAYLPVFEGILDALGIDRCVLYGAATGAQLALEFACAHPGRVSLLVMDTAGHIPQAECERLVDGYFPDVTPRADGAHLATLWGLVRDLGVFFPWNDTRPEARIRRDLPPAAFMHGMLLDYLRAGTRYDWAYRPAFYNERAERVARCTVPGLLTRWPSSIALSITDALVAAGLPAGFRVLDLGPTLEERARGIAQAIAAAPADPEAAPSPARVPVASGFASCLLGEASAPLHARFSASGAGRPLVALHRAGASARQLERTLAPLAGHRPVLAIDLPGHGDSETSELAEPASIAALDESLGRLGLRDAELLGDGLGGDWARRLHAISPQRYARLGLISRRLPAGDPAPWPSLRPSLDGAHLFAAWHLLRDRQLWWPWYRRTAASLCSAAAGLRPDSLHADWVDLMKCGERFQALAAQEASGVPGTVAAAAAPGFVALAESACGLTLSGDGDVGRPAGWEDVLTALGAAVRPDQRRTSS